MDNSMMSSVVKGLLSEVKFLPNLEIIQVIKAADQLYFKDKILYTDVRPEMSTTISSRKGDQRKGEDQPQKQEKKGKPDGRENGKNKRQQEKLDNNLGNDGLLSGGGSSSKLQQAIEQAKKTVKQALDQQEQNIDESLDIDQQLSRMKTENSVLHDKLNEQEKKLNRLEKLTLKLLESAGLSESDILQ